MTVPPRLFSSNIATVTIMSGTPIIGATVDARCSSDSAAVACVHVGGRSECSAAIACVAGEFVPIHIPMCQFIVGADATVVLDVSGYGISADSGLIAMSALHDPL